MAVSQDVQQQLASTGSALGAVWGGPQKKRYYTPWGEEVWAIPSIRDWVQKDGAGRVVAQGERDANLDKGWSLTMPAELKAQCSACSRSHDTTEESEACVQAKNASAKEWENKARQMMGGDADSSTIDRVGALEQGMARIESLLLKVLER